jgi:C-terminal processing protease CtpA/Prc
MRHRASLPKHCIRYNAPIMRYSILVAVTLAWAAGASVSSQDTGSSSSLSRLAATGKLWATIKYFHPSLSESDPAAWDTALLDSIPRVQAATTRDEFAAALTSMMEPLKDSLTRIERVEAEGSGPLYGFASVEDRGGVLVVTSGDTGGDPLDSGDKVTQRLPAANGVVFDLRQGTVHPWLWDTRSTVAVASKPISYPAHRFRVHAGLVTPRGAPDVPYFSGWLTRAAPAAPQPPPGTRDIPVVFLVRTSEQVPLVAAALQSRGTGYIIAEQPVDDRAIARHGYARHYRMPLPDNLAAYVRTSQMINSDGTVGLAADRIVPRSEALNFAFGAALGKVKHVARSPAPSTYQIKSTENAYADSLYPAEPLRLLGAFRIWSVFEWFSPYRHLMEPGWDNVLEQALANFSAARNAREYHLAVAEMVAHVNDTHSETSSPVISEFWGSAAPAIALRPVEGKAVVVAITDESARSSGMAVGDVILAVDGEMTEARLSRIGRYISASTPQALRRDSVNRLLRGSDNSKARVRVAKADGSEQEITLERRASFVRGTTATTGADVFRLLPGNIGYIDLRLLKNHDVDSVFESLNGTVGLVFDMRGYPNDTRRAVARKLIAATRSLRTSWPYVRVLFEPGTETRQDLMGISVPIQASPTPYRGNTVMLIDDRAQSQSEATAEMLREAHGTRFVGTATAGANGEGSNFSVPGGLSVGLTGIGIIRADGTTMQRVGIKPDVEVAPTLLGIRSGRDEVLERAVAYLRAGLR